MAEITERQLLIRGRAFGAFSIIEKTLAGHKKSFRRPHTARGPDVVQAYRTLFDGNIRPATERTAGVPWRNPLDVVQNYCISNRAYQREIWVSLRKLLVHHPPWCPELVTGLVSIT